MINKVVGDVIPVLSKLPELFVVTSLVLHIQSGTPPPGGAAWDEGEAGSCVSDPWALKLFMVGLLGVVGCGASWVSQNRLGGGGCGFLVDVDPRQIHLSATFPTSAMFTNVLLEGALFQ